MSVKINDKYNSFCCKAIFLLLEFSLFRQAKARFMIKKYTKLKQNPAML